MSAATTTTTVSNGSDPYQPYAAMDGNPGKGKGHGIVPEASSYGILFVGLVIAALCLSRYLNRRVVKSL